MKKFFNKLFSDANKLINITCAILSVLVFALCIFNVVSKIFGNKYMASTSELTVEDNYITNDGYAMEGSFKRQEKISLTKEEDGTYGKKAVLEALQFLEKERNRVYSEGGVVSDSNGITTATSMGVEVVQSMSILCQRDITGNKYYEEATTELSSSGYGITSAISAFATPEKARYEKNSNVKLTGNFVKGVFSGNNINQKNFNDFIEETGSFTDIYPLSYTTNIDEIDLESTSLIENLVGYKLTYNVAINGSDFIKNFEKKFGKAAEAVKNSIKISRFQVIINFNKYGQVTTYDSTYAFSLRKVVPVLGEVSATTEGGISTVISYKGDSFKVKEI